MYNSWMDPISGVSPLVYLLMAVDVILKGVTLYKSARKDQKVWFVALLLVNSIGILPIIYLFVNGDIALSKSTAPAKKATKKAKK